MKTYESLNDEGKIKFKQIIMNEVVLILNKKVPFAVDKYTTLESATSDKENTITFNYSINEEGEKIAKANSASNIKDLIKQISMLNACYREDVKVFFVIGINVKYIYSINNKELFSFNINENDCKENMNK